MRKVTIACFLPWLIAISCNAQGSAVTPTASDAFVAGGTPIVIPPPVVDMTEVGDEIREAMKVFVPPSSRLLAAFALTNDMPRLAHVTDYFTISQYATVTVPRGAEHETFNLDEFKEVTSVAADHNGEIPPVPEEAEAVFNQRLKSLFPDGDTPSLNSSLRLGCLFSKENAYGFGMVERVSIGGQTSDMTMVCGTVLMRVKQRLIFVYLYAEYRGIESVRWIRRTTENWASAILLANK